MALPDSQNFLYNKQLVKELIANSNIVIRLSFGNRPRKKRKL